MTRGEREDLLMRLPWLLGERLDAAERAQQMVREAVRDLVLAGYSWADVGRMLGVSRQAAQKRYGAEVVWWREHMGKRLPWDDWTDELDPQGVGPSTCLRWSSCVSPVLRKRPMDRNRMTLRHTGSRLEVIIGDPSDDCPLCRPDASQGADGPPASEARPDRPHLGTRRTPLGLPLDGPETA